MTIPAAEIKGTGGERVKAWLFGLFAPPRVMAESHQEIAWWWWAASGAMAAGFALGLMVLVSWNALTNVNLALSMAWAVFVVLGVPIFILPFMLCFALVRYLDLRSRYVGAAYGAVFHTAAHCGVLYALQLDPLAFPVILAPLLVGALWGSWLPAALAE